MIQIKQYFTKQNNIHPPPPTHTHLNPLKKEEKEEEERNRFHFDPEEWMVVTF